MVLSPGRIKKREKTFDILVSCVYNLHRHEYGLSPLFLWEEQETPGIVDR